MNTERVYPTAEGTSAAIPDSIRREILVAIVFVVAVCVVVMWSLSRVERDSRAAVATALKTVLRTTEESLALWESQRVEKVQVWAMDPRVIAAAEALLGPGGDPQRLADHPAQQVLRDYLGPQLQTAGDLGFFIIGPDRTNLGSMRDENLGQINLADSQRRETLDRVFGGETLLIPPMVSDVALPDEEGQLKGGQPTILVATPIRDEESATVGVLTIRVDQKRDFTRIARLGRLGESGETYAFDRKGRLVSDSRFYPQLETLGLIEPGEIEVLSLRVADPGGELASGFQPEIPVSEWPLTVMAASATAGRSGSDVDGYRDYRGVNVLGAWTWNERLELGLATEVDEAEAMLPYYATRFAILLFTALIVVFTGFLWGSLIVIRRRSESSLTMAHATVFEREAHLRSIFDSALDGIITIDEQGTITSFNPASRKIFGYEEEEVIGENVKMLMPEPYQGEHDGYLKSYLETGKRKIIGIGREVEGKRKDGTTFPLDLAVTEMLREGSTRSFTGVLRDITDRKLAVVELLERDQKLRLHDQNTPLAVIEWNEDFEVVAWNPAAGEIFGYSADEAIGRHAAGLIVPENVREIVDQVWEALLAKQGGQRSVNENITKDGKAIVCDWYNTPLVSEDGTVFGAYSLVMDVTEQKAAEEALGVAAKEAERSAREAGAANLAKTTFLANMSHEIRTPMNAIIGFAEILGRKLNDPESKGHLDSILASGRSLLALINEILDLSKIEAGKMDVKEEAIEVWQLFHDLQAVYGARADAKGLDFHLEIEPGLPEILIVDDAHLRQTLINLIGNAIKFTGQGYVKLGVSCQEGAGGERRVDLHLSVEDTGVGIPQDQLDSIFGDFNQRSGQSINEYGGTGLGLSISRHLVTLMGDRSR